MKLQQPTLLLLVSAATAQAFMLPFSSPVCSRNGRTVVRMGLFDMFGSNPEREAQKEEDFRRQQEILRLRQNPQATQKYFQEVNKRRQTVSDNVNEKFNLAKDGKDPVIKWLELKKKGVIPEREKYEGVEDKRGIVVPTVPFGNAKYDNGERFDLRLPYVDDGYVDPDASLGATFARLFGGGKPRKPTTIPNDVPPAKPTAKGGKPSTPPKAQQQKKNTPPPPPPAAPKKKTGWW